MNPEIIEIGLDLLATLDKDFLIRELKGRMVTNHSVNAEIVKSKNFFEVFRTDITTEGIKEYFAAERLWKGAISYESDLKFYFLGTISPAGDDGYIASLIETGEITGCENAGLVKNLLSNFEGHQVFFWCRKSFEDSGSTIMISEGVREFTGYSPKEITSLAGNLFYLIHKDDLQRVIKEINDYKTNKLPGTLRLCYRMMRKDGTCLWVEEIIKAKRDSSGAFTAFSGTVYNIDPLKSAELLLNDERELLSVQNASKDRFINILSHDLRGPYTSILGFAEILLNETTLPVNEKNEYLSYIYDASKSQLQFINYLLDWSRLKTGKLKLEPQRIPVKALVYNAVSSLTGNAIRKNIEISVDIMGELFVQADERLMNQVLINLLNNAIKFSHENGRIEVTANIFNNKQVEFVVKDHGIGMAPEDQIKLFTFEKTFSRDGTKGEKGSGFGLTLVKEIIDRHNGEIWFYSEEHSGTEFHFTLPVPTNLVIIVQDDLILNGQLTEIIKSGYPDFTVLSYTNTFEAIEEVESRSPNLLVLNHELPLMTAKKFLNSLKSDSNYKFPVIIIGAPDEAEVNELYAHDGADYIFDKKFEIKEFNRVLKIILK